uniref:Uncharacterized protein n=1 Tax=Oryza glumipatula TaxID=40148 RepID=A0A0D9YS20_9ORYZ
MAELALGLETSGRPFLWAVQPLVGFDHKDGFDPSWLPGTSGGWVGADPGALVHGRVLESIRHGVPLLGWPVGAEQFFNAMVVVEWGGRGLRGGGAWEPGELGGGEWGGGDGNAGEGEGRGDEEEGGGDRRRNGSGVGGAGRVVGGEIGTVPYYTSPAPLRVHIH